MLNPKGFETDGEGGGAREAHLFRMCDALLSKIVLFKNKEGTSER